MKKLITIVFVFTFVSSSSFGQLSGGGSGGFLTPLGEAGGDTQFGLNLLGRYAVSDQFNVGVNIGYYQRSQSAAFIGNVVGFTLPTTLCAEYILTDDDLRLYGVADLGLYTFGARVSGNTNSDSFLGLAGGAGAKYAINRELDLDVSVKYHFVLRENNNMSLFGTNIGILYNF